MSYSPAGAVSFPIIAGTTQYILVRDVATYLGGGSQHNGQPNVLMQTSASAHRLGERPVAPLALNVPVAATTQALDLSWTPVSGASFYRVAVQRTTCPNRWEITRAPPASGPLNLTASSYRTDTRAVPGNGAYYFSVKACNDWGCSDWTVAPAMGPVQISGLTGTSNSGVCPGDSGFTMPASAFIRFTPSRVLVPRPAISGGVGVLAGVPRDANGTPLSGWDGAAMSMQGPSPEQFLSYAHPFRNFGIEVQVDTSAVLRLYRDQLHIGQPGQVQLSQTVRAYPVPGAIASVTVPQESPSCAFSMQWSASEGATHYQVESRFGDATQPWQRVLDQVPDRLATVTLAGLPLENRPPVFMRVRGCDTNVSCQADDTDETRWRIAGPILISGTSGACTGGASPSGDIQAAPEIVNLAVGETEGLSTIRWTSNLALLPTVVREERSLDNQLLATQTLATSAVGEINQTIRLDRRYRYLLKQGAAGAQTDLDHVDVRAVSAAVSSADWLDTDPKPVPSAAEVQVPAHDVGAVEVGASAGVFRVDESGAASYDLPLYAAPATAGVAPRMSLAYSSSAGDGHLGVGWQLTGLSAITRCRKTSESGDGPGPHPQVAFNDADAYCLDGQRLIATGPGSDARGSYTGYRTEIDSFSVIRAYGAAGIVGPGWWSVWGKDGLQRVYGLAGDDSDTYSCAGVCAGRLFRNQDGVVDPTRVMAWAISKIRSRDSATGVIEFSYTFDQPNGEYSIAKVLFSGTENPVEGRATPPRAALDFTYGEPRAVPKLQYSAGARIRTSRYLASITSSNADNQVVRRYTLGYGTNLASGLRQIESIQECAGDGTCLPPTDFVWSRHANRIESAGYLMGQGAFRNLVDAKFGDVNGDGRTDMVWTEGESDENQRVIVGLTMAGPGTVTFDRVTTPRILIDAFDKDRGWHLLDYNQDGRDDLLIAECEPGCSTAYWRVYLANGSASVFETTRLQIPLIPVVRGNSDWTTDAMLADFTGDGLVDLAVPTTTASGAPVKLKVHALRRAAADNMRCLLNGIATPCPYEFDEGREIQFDVPAYSLREYDYDEYDVVDVNGDGLADMLLKYTSNQTRGAESQLVPDPARSRAATDGMSVGDRAPQGDTWYWGVFINRGKTASQWRFELVRSWSDAVAYNESGAFRLTDFNGDGLADVAYKARRNQALGIQDKSWRYALNRGDGSFTEDRCVHRDRSHQCEYIDNGATVRLQDYDADGDLDFWVAMEEVPQMTDFPASCGSDYNTQPFAVLRWDGERFEQAPRCQVEVGALQHGEDDRNYFLDFDGDGQTDALRIADNGNYYVARRDFLPPLPGQTVAQSARFIARHTISEIVSGLYAQTQIRYAPMAWSSVYRRDYAAAYMRSSGRGAPVMDLGGATYLVHRVGSSAPTDANQQAMNYVSYRYVGGKAQGGGRGALGMRQVYSFDEQTSVLSLSEYHQNWPLTGRPMRSQSQRIAGNFPAACTSGEICVSRAPMCTAGGQPDPTQVCDGFALPGSLLGSAMDSWSYRSTDANGSELNGALPATPARAFVYQSGSNKLSHECATSELSPGACQSSSLIKREQITFGSYDAAGNLRSSASEVFDSSGQSRQRISSQFDYLSPSWADPWLGGLLQRSSVTTQRGSQSRLRVSGFDYFADGTVRAEHVQPEGGVSERLSTYYVRNSAGMVRLKAVCSSHYSETDCIASDEGPGVLIPRGVLARPSDPQMIRRVESYRIDPSFRFVDGTWTGFDVGGEHLQFRESARVLDLDQDGKGDRNPTGEALATADANSLIGHSRYTPFGNKYFEYVVGSQATRLTRYRWCAGSQPPGSTGVSGCPAGAVYRLSAESAGLPGSWTWYDKLGRELLRASQAFSGDGAIHVRQSYDLLGRVISTSEPYIAPPGTRSACGGSIFCTQVQFDFLGRSLRVDHPDHHATRPVQTRTSYAVGSCEGVACTVQTVITPRQHAQKQWTDALGQVVLVEDAKGLQIQYTFDAHGNATRIRRTVDGRIIDNLAEYDVLGRRQSAVDQDFGSRYSVYNALGEVVEERNGSARDGQCTRTWYDARGRAWRRIDYRSASCAGPVEAQSEWTHDRGNRYGLLTMERELVGGLTRSFGYDALMRQVSSDTTLVGRSYRQESTFDQFGRPFQHFDLVFAAGTPEAISASRARRIGIEHQYNANGFQYRVVNAQLDTDVIFEVFEMDARGKVRSARRGDSAALGTEISYDAASGRLTGIRSGINGALQSLDYGDYDSNGNLGMRADNVLGTREVFGYDELNRLTSSTVERGRLMLPVTMAYDALGNFRSKGGESYVNGSYAGVTQSCARTQLGPHLVARVGTTAYCWDDNGNQLSAGDGNPNSAAPNQRFVSYTVNNQPSRIRVTGSHQGTVDYRYGPSRELIRRIDAGSVVAQNDTVHYIGGVEVFLLPDSGNETQRREYKRSVAGVMQVTMRTALNRGQLQKSSERRFMFKEKLGSTDVIAAADGSLVQRMSFDVWGQRRNAETWAAFSGDAIQTFDSSITRKAYTGHESVDIANLIHMGGRLYDPRMARFLSADPIIQDPFNTQNLNRYSYVLNNPMNYVDPTGYSWLSDNWRSIASIVVTIVAPYAWAAMGVTQGMMTSVVTGMMSGAVQTGSLKGALMGGLGAGMFYGVGSYFQDVGYLNDRISSSGAFDGVFGTNLKAGQFAAKVAAHAATGGVMGVLQGGKFGHGFASAGFAEAMSPAVSLGSTREIRVLRAALLGGTASVLAGGKFANGAVSAAFSRQFNEESHASNFEVRWEASHKLNRWVTASIDQDGEVKLRAAMDLDGAILSVDTNGVGTVALSSGETLNFSVAPGEVGALTQYSKSFDAAYVNATIAIDHQGLLTFDVSLQAPWKFFGVIPGPSISLVSVKGNPVNELIEAVPSFRKIRDGGANLDIELWRLQEGTATSDTCRDGSC